MRSRFIARACVAVVAAIATASVSYGQAAGTRPNFKNRSPSKAEWVDSIREAPNGTTYHTFKSATLDGEVSYLIYLPPDYETQTAERYPVIYWLHGLGGNQRGGAMMFVPFVDEAIRSKSLPPAIVVCVNGMVNSFYNDWPDGTRPIETLIVKELVPHVDATYRTIATREGRLIEGYSMGGYGAAHLGFKYPDVFGTVVVDAGALITEIALSGPMIGPIFQGAWSGDLAKFTAEHPMQLVEKNADKIRGRTNIRIGVGGDDSLLARTLPCTNSSRSSTSHTSTKWCPASVTTGRSTIAPSATRPSTFIAKRLRS